MIKSWGEVVGAFCRISPNALLEELLGETPVPTFLGRVANTRLERVFGVRKGRNVAVPFEELKVALHTIWENAW